MTSLRSGIRGALWFVLAGLAACAGSASYEASGGRVARSAPDPVRLLTYNVRHGAGMHTDAIDLGRAAAVIRSLAPDVVLLQEIDRGTRRASGVDQAAELARLTGLPYYSFGPFMDYDGGRYGMAVLSRHPLIEARNHVLPRGAEPRSALEVRVRIGEGGPTLRLVGIHLYRTEVERLAQAKRLLALFAEPASGDPAPNPGPILAGDFNSLPGDTVMRTLSSRWRIVPKDARARRTFPADRPEREIDYFLLPPEEPYRVLRQRVVDERRASDHRPVLLVLEVGRGDHPRD